MINTVTHELIGLKETSGLNIFSRKYALKESKLFENTYYDKEGILVNRRMAHTSFTGNYLQKYQDWKESTVCFSIDGSLYMSITPMEVSSHYVPCAMAKGDIVVGGCGLGYFILKCMAKPEVKSITVYEIDSRVIDYFKSTYCSRPGFHKVRFLHESFLDMEGETYDFLYNDIYLELGSYEAPEQTKELLKYNNIKKWHYWGLEYDITKDIQAGMYSAMSLINGPMKKLFSHSREVCMEYRTGNSPQRALPFSSKNVIKDLLTDL